jgi:hypothetical protein
MIKLTCKYCWPKLRFIKTKFVKRHIRNCHWKEEQKIKDDKEKAKQERMAKYTTCKICNKQCQTKEQLKEHHLIHLGY